MNKLLLIIFFAFSIIIYSQNNSRIKVRYETKIVNDSVKMEQFQTFEYILLANETNSLFYFENAKNYFNGNNEHAEKTNTSAGNIPKYPRFVGSFFKEGTKIIAYLPVGKYIFKFEEPDLRWEILNEKKQIMGYNARLAKTKTENNELFYAWFTDDIPINDGPFRFKGLTGLILKIYNENKTIQVSATEIMEREEQIETIKYPELIEAKNKKQYLEARKNYTEKPSIYNNDIRLFDATGKEITNKISERLKKITVYLD